MLGIETRLSVSWYLSSSEWGVQRIMNIKDKKGDTDFQLSQIVGTSALEGVMISDETKKLLKQVLEGKVSIKSAKQAVLKKYVKGGE